MVTYRQAGVDIAQGNELVHRLRRYLPGIGFFSGMYPLKIKQYTNPVLVSSTDGVGTKLIIAKLLNDYRTIGIDLVAMNVNDVVTCGAEPLFFLDYYACGKLTVPIAEQVIRGINEGCKQSGCILIGGETAEMPGLYRPGDFDIAGFCVGIVGKGDIVDGKKIQPGDILVGIPSSGIHSNGYSLVRKILTVKQIKGTLGKELLVPTRIYVPEILRLKHSKQGKTWRKIKAIGHITGGGFYDNIIRLLPANLRVVIYKNTWQVPSIFQLLKRQGKLNESEMYQVFNMGIGMILIVNPNALIEIKRELVDCRVIGTVEKGRQREVKLV